MTGVLRKSAVRLFFGAIVLRYWRSTRTCAGVAVLGVSVVTQAQLALPAAQPSAATAVSNSAKVAPAPLPVDIAFPILASFNKGEASVNFYTVPGHYLYRDRMEFQLDGKRIELDSIKQNAAAKGKMKNDPSFGAVAVFEQPIALVAGRSKAKTAQLLVTYQGCSELAGVCYPPTRRSFTLTAGASDIAAKEVATSGLAERYKKQVSQ
jgi:thioredoxin:protein disulfide reductase